MKLNEKEIDNIIDDILQEDDVWAEFDAEWVEEYLNDYTKYEYDNEDLNEISKRVQDARKEIQEEYKSEEKESLYRAIDEFIDNSNIHLSLTDIGKVLVKLANNYLEE